MHMVQLNKSDFEFERVGAWDGLEGGGENGGTYIIIISKTKKINKSKAKKNNKMSFGLQMKELLCLGSRCGFSRMTTKGFVPNKITVMTINS